MRAEKICAWHRRLPDQLNGTVGPQGPLDNTGANKTHISSEEEGRASRRKGGESPHGTWKASRTLKYVVRLQTVMERRNIGVLRVQETHRRNSDYFCTEEGYLVVLSGGVGEGREWVGVGFIFAPFMRRSLIGFRQLSSRSACAKIRVQGGKIALWSVYAPHGGKPPDEQQAFYTDLGVHLGQSSSHGATLVCGDFNARLHRQNPDEQDIVGPFVFGNPSAPHVQGGNRDLLIELCVAHGMIVANTFVNAPPEQQITYYEIGSSPHEDRNYRNFAQLDFILTPRRWAGAVADVRSCMEEALATHHFLVEVVLDARVDKPARKVSQPRYDKARAARRRCGAGVLGRVRGRSRWVRRA